MLKCFVIRNFIGTLSSAEMLKGYMIVFRNAEGCMLIYRNAERVQGQRRVANPCIRITNHGVIRTTRVGIYGTYMSSCFMYLCVLCYCDACLKSSALRVGVKTLHNVNWLFNSNSGTVYFQDASLDILYILRLCESPLCGTILDN